MGPLGVYWLSYVWLWFTFSCWVFFFFFFGISNFCLKKKSLCIIWYSNSVILSFADYCFCFWSSTQLSCLIWKCKLCLPHSDIPCWYPYVVLSASSCGIFSCSLPSACIIIWAHFILRFQSPPSLHVLASSISAFLLNFELIYQPHVYRYFSPAKL